MNNSNIESAKSFIANYATTAESPIANVAFKEAYSHLTRLVAAFEAVGEVAEPTEEPKQGRSKSNPDPEGFIAARADEVSARCAEVLNTETTVKAEALYKGLSHLLGDVSLAQFKQVFGKLLKAGTIKGVESRLGRNGGYKKVA
jgi:hypothetical protein